MRPDPTRGRSGGLHDNAEPRRPEQETRHRRRQEGRVLEELRDPTAGRGAGTFWNMEKDPTRARPTGGRVPA